MEKDTFRVYKLEFNKTTKTKRGTAVRSEKAELDTDNGLNQFRLENVFDFFEGLKTISKLYKAAYKDDAFCEVRFSVATYQRVPEFIEYTHGVPYKTYIKTLSFDAWEYRGYPVEDVGFDDNDKPYFYLSPDTKYTKDYYDMMLSAESAERMLKDLSEAVSSAELNFR